MAVPVVTIFNAARMALIEARAIVGAVVNGDNLTLTRNNGETLGPFNVRGPKGDTGNVNALSAWPIGSVYISVDINNPSTKLGGGTWAVFATGQTLVGVSTGETEFNSVMKTGGAKAVTLTALQSGLRQHNHTATAAGSFSGGAGYNSVPTAYYSLANYALTLGSDYATRVMVWNNTTEGGHGHAITVQNQAALAAQDAHTNLQPYVTVYMWRRTA